MAVADAGQGRVETLDLSERLRLLMHHHRLTVAELADKAGVSKSAMEKYLAGPSSPRATAIAELCINLGVGSEWLLLGHRDEDAYLVRGTARGLIAELLADLKGPSSLAATFAALEPGTQEWRMFVLQLSDERAIEINTGLAKARRTKFLAAAQGERVIIGDPVPITFPETPTVDGAE